MFSYRSAPTSAQIALRGMIDRTRAAGHDVRDVMYGNALIHRSRNTAIAKLRPDAEYVLLVDDDMVPAGNALLALMQHNLPVVSAACTTRVPPVEIAAKVYDAASDQFVPLDALRPNAVLTGQFAVGAAFVLFQASVLAQLAEYYLSARDWLDESARLLNRLHVRTENREKERARKEEIRRAHFARERIIRVFDFPVNDGELQLGEDICVARKLIALGVPVALDTRVMVGHIGEYPYGVWDLGDLEKS